MKKNKNITTLEEHFNARYGKIGSKRRLEFERKSKTFMIGELIKEQRKLANMTQDDLAKKTGTQKSYISRIEKGQSDIQLATLFKIVERGLGRKLTLSIGK